MPSAEGPQKRSEGAPRERGGQRRGTSSSPAQHPHQRGSRTVDQTAATSRQAGKSCCQSSPGPWAPPPVLPDPQHPGRKELMLEAAECLWEGLCPVLTTPAIGPGQGKVRGRARAGFWTVWSRASPLPEATRSSKCRSPLGQRPPGPGTRRHKAGPPMPGCTLPAPTPGPFWECSQFSCGASPNPPLHVLWGHITCGRMIKARNLPELMDGSKQPCDPDWPISTLSGALAEAPGEGAFDSTHKVGRTGA